MKYTVSIIVETVNRYGMLKYEIYTVLYFNRIIS